jgi:hypothetical protein
MLAEAGRRRGCKNPIPKNESGRPTLAAPTGLAIFRTSIFYPAVFSKPARDAIGGKRRGRPLKS